MMRRFPAVRSFEGIRILQKKPSHNSTMTKSTLLQHLFWEQIKNHCKLTPIKNKSTSIPRFEKLNKKTIKLYNYIIKQFFPKPNEKNSYCSVCKEHYFNYYEHIRCDEHLEKIDAAIYNSQIKKLCENFREEWDGAHEKADNQMMNEYLRLQKECESENLDEEDSGQEKDLNMNDSEELSSQQEQLQEESDEFDGKLIQNEFIEKVEVKKPFLEIKPRVDKIQKQSKEKKKKGDQDQYQNQYIRTSVLPPKQIKTRSAQIIDRNQISYELKDMPNTKQKLQLAKHMKNQTVSHPSYHPSEPPLPSQPEPTPQQPAKNELVVLLRKNRYGKYEIAKQSQEKPKKKSQNQNLSLQVKIRKDTKQIIKPEGHRKKAKKDEDYDINDDLDSEKGNLCDMLKNKVRKQQRQKKTSVNTEKFNRQKYENEHRLSGSNTPERGLYPPDGNRSFQQNIPYPPYYYGGYRMPPQQNRMQIYPYPTAPPMMNGGVGAHKETTNSNQNQSSKPPQSYYPYPFPYGNNWYNPYMMPPHMMKDRESQPNKNIASSPHPQYQKSSMYPPYPPYYQNSNSSSYMPPYMMNQSGYSQNNKPNQQQPSQTPHSQNQSQPVWYHPGYYNMQMNSQQQQQQQTSPGVGHPSNYSQMANQHQKYMGYPYLKPPQNSNSEDAQPDNFERK